MGYREVGNVIYGTGRTDRSLLVIVKERDGSRKVSPSTVNNDETSNGSTAEVVSSISKYISIGHGGLPREGGGGGGRQSFYLRAAEAPPPIEHRHRHKHVSDVPYSFIQE